MRSTRFHPSSPLISLALLVGCGGSDLVTTPSDAEAARFAAAPAASQSGAEVIRDWIITTVLADPNLALAVGFEDLATACAEGEVVISPHRGQAVFTPSGKGQLHTFSREAFVQVFENSPTAELCDLPAAPVASGTVTFSQVVHEVPEGAPGAFSLHVTVQGTVHLTSGGQARLLATAQVVIRPDGTTVLDQARIRLTPI